MDSTLPNSASLKLVITGHFQIPPSPVFNGHLRSDNDDTAEIQLETEIGNVKGPRMVFVFNETTLDLGQGFLTWLSYRDRSGLELKAITIEFRHPSQEAQDLVAKFFAPLRINPKVVIKPNSFLSPASPLSPDLFAFPSYLYKLGVASYKDKKFAQSLDYFQSALLTSSEFDGSLQKWDEQYHTNAAAWLEQSYKFLRNILQIHIETRSCAEAEGFPFTGMLKLSFDARIKVASRKRGFYLLARYKFDQGSVDEAFMLAQSARCLDLDYQQPALLLKRIKPSLLGQTMCKPLIDQFSKENEIQRRVTSEWTTVKSTEISEGLRDACTICYQRLESHEGHSQLHICVKPPCNHLMHEICFTYYIRMNAISSLTCPTCRVKWFDNPRLLLLTRRAVTQ